MMCQFVGLHAVCPRQGAVVDLTGSVNLRSSTAASADPTPEAGAVLTVAAPDPTTDYDSFLDHMVNSAIVIGSPGYPWPEGALRQRAIDEFKRAYNPTGSARQMAAIRSDGDRTARLSKLTVPTVVLHGADDPLVPLAGGKATARAIAGAELRVVPGMGHDLPPALFEIIADAIFSAAARGAEMGI